MRRGVGLLVLGSVAWAQAPGPRPEKPAVPPTEERAPAFLGVATAPVEIEDAGGRRLALRVLTVVPGSPAARVIEVGDLLLAVDGVPLSGPAEKANAAFRAAIRARSPGDVVTLRVRRATVEASTFLDEVLEGRRSASGPGAAERALPDLDELLERNPGRLVGVRARRYARERDVRVRLGSAPGSTRRPLPPNDALRPDLAGLSLGPRLGAVAEFIAHARLQDGRAVASVYASVRDRFERDEGREDPYRLKTVRFLHRDPLRLGAGTDALAESLAPLAERSVGSLRLAVLLEAAARHLDAVAVVDSGVRLEPPPPGAGAKAHALYLCASVRESEARMERALEPLGSEGRARLRRSLPELAARFAEGIYLHDDPDPERARRHVEAVRLAAKVDRARLLWALRPLLEAVRPAYLRQLRDDLRAAEERGERSGHSGGIRGELLWFSDAEGFPMAIGGSGDNEYRRDLRLVVDLGGDDRYHARVGAGVPDAPAALCIDLGGDDRYQSTVPYAQGAGFLGVGLLVDASGNDRYTTSAPFAQGASLLGAGLLVDANGDDAFRATRYAQGAALLQGVGALLDGGGDDLISAGLYVQGFAGPGAFGVLLARGGNDRYVALGGAPCSYGDPGTFRAMSQGAAIGFRHLASGGVALLLDNGGNDTYEAGNFSQGGGYYYGWGALIDRGAGDDEYEGSRYSLGFAAHSALGSFWDDGGNDRYRGWVGAQASAAWDLSATFFLDEWGNDRYETGPGFSVGASAHNGFSVFLDLRGADVYRVAPGRAGPNDYHGGASLSVFLDAGPGDDRYLGGGLRDRSAAVAPEVSLTADLPVPLGRRATEWIERLLR
ncbi:MAG: PDZ domain-containing protein [Planctomycetota bacterium]|nr:MAG: PDZ domain-containing protein [Planctomycetota bacterium]